MSTIKEVAAPRISPYLQWLYGLFNLLVVGVMVFSFMSAGKFQKSHTAAVSSSNRTYFPPTRAKSVEYYQSQGDTAKGEAALQSPERFPPCSMDACFNYSRCDNMDELLLYHYNDAENSPIWYLKDALARSPYYTKDPEKACLFLVTVDTGRADVPRLPALSTLPYWNDGMNHVLLSTRRKPPATSVQNAALLTSITHQTLYRAGFDISAPLPQKRSYPSLQELKALRRKYFLTFKGPRYSQGFGGGAFREMHNGDDIIVATTCKQAMDSRVSAGRSDLKADCANDLSTYNRYKFDDLMNSTFGLCPPSSFRMLEVMSAGSIPVLVSDKFVLPFDTLIDWKRCLFVFPTTETHRVVRALRSLSDEEIEFRRDYCLFIYREFFANDDKIVDTTAMALKARFFGVLPKLIPRVPLPPTHFSLHQNPTRKKTA